MIETSISCMETSMRLYRHEFCPLWRSVEKGLVNPWACAEEFPRANEIVALAQSYDKLTAGMQHCYTVCIAIQFRRPIRFKVCFTASCGHAITCKRSHSERPTRTKLCMALSAHMRMRRRTRTKDKFTRPFSSSKVGSPSVW